MGKLLNVKNTQKRSRLYYNAYGTKLQALNAKLSNLTIRIAPTRPYYTHFSRNNKALFCNFFPEFFPFWNPPPPAAPACPWNIRFSYPKDMPREIKQNAHLFQMRAPLSGSPVIFCQYHYSSSIFLCCCGSLHNPVASRPDRDFPSDHPHSR